MPCDNLTLLDVIPPHCANADTGSTGNYMSFRDANVLLDIKPTNSPLTVTLPDGTTVTSTHTALLNLPQLPLGARHVDVFPGFIGSLLSTGVLCDHGLKAVYTSYTVDFIDKDGTVILQGNRSPFSKLWMVNICPLPSRLRYDSDTAKVSGTISSSYSDPCAFAVITEATGTVQQIVDYYFATMGSCVPSTLIAALDAGYVKLPGLSSQMIRRHPPKAIAIAQGHPITRLPMESLITKCVSNALRRSI